MDDDGKFMFEMYIPVEIEWPPRNYSGSSESDEWGSPKDNYELLTNQSMKHGMDDDQNQDYDQFVQKQQFALFMKNQTIHRKTLVISKDIVRHLSTT